MKKVPIRQADLYILEHFSAPVFLFNVKDQWSNSHSIDSTALVMSFYYGVWSRSNKAFEKSCRID